MCFNRNTWPTWFCQGRLKMNTFANSIKTDSQIKSHSIDLEDSANLGVNGHKNKSMLSSPVKNKMVCLTTMSQ